ncbi:sodium-dependent transporter [Hoyosella rhizosphaerae]|uniref:Transporter n=1 Tax=Hoyosella rhizosphaerae TaxID=1755582 RepID=A0A916UD57_9ACTN|nr:sodium-dependent transporter [Hoyosella rhizosphaerae]MBN4925634.1 sodium-dependent transporter [Hoyosella rhizosphaerae]GGC69113.1 transporter [Hoyosella rhizosphaerae]
MDTQREVWSTRSVFILAAIGSAVGLGNIWRFPFVAYENGAGAFILPYLIALLTAGIPLLFLDYAIGHKFRASPPLAFRRLSRWTETFGWWQVGICFVIAVYYAVIVAWAARYAFFSIGQLWGDDPEGFLFGTFLQQEDGARVGFDLVPGVAWPLLLVWIGTIAVLAFGVQRGIGASAKIFVPLLVVLFLTLVIRSLFLDGAIDGLNAFFQPDWSLLTNPTVWIAAYGQIFFSLSIAFGIMITYASYLKIKTNLTGSGLVVAFSNSSFEILAGIGVFAALGYMAAIAQTGVDEVVSGGIGLAFIAFPQIISAMPGGSIFGAAFFTCLLFAGFTSLISIVQVVVSSVQDKVGLSRGPAVLIVGGAMTAVSMALFPTTTGVGVLDVVDKFVNNLGIVGVALVVIITVVWVLRRSGEFAEHLNAVSSFKIGRVWQLCIGIATPVVLGYMLVSEMMTLAEDGYGTYPASFTLALGWTVQAILIVVAIGLTLLPWRKGTDLGQPHSAEFITKAGSR